MLRIQIQQAIFLVRVKELTDLESEEATVDGSELRVVENVQVSLDPDAASSELREDLFDPDRVLAFADGEGAEGTEGG